MASFKQSNFLTGKKAGADLSADQHKIGKLDASGDVVLAGLGEGLGVIMSQSKSGDFVELAVTGGGALVKSGATIAAGDEIASDASGLAKVAAVGENVIGIAMEAAVSGDVFEMFCNFDKKTA